MDISPPPQQDLWGLVATVPTNPATIRPLPCLPTYPTSVHRLYLQGLLPWRHPYPWMPREGRCDRPERAGSEFQLLRGKGRGGHRGKLARQHQLDGMGSISTPQLHSSAAAASRAAPSMTQLVVLICSVEVGHDIALKSCLVCENCHTECLVSTCLPP